LKVNGIAPSIPKDLYHLIKKAVNVRKHIEKFRADIEGKFRLILIKSRIRRLARYYREVNSLLSTWRYQSKKADTLIA
jgi:small subunit ribosomal protein S13e